MRQNLLVSNRGQITLPASVGKRLGIQPGGVVTLEEKDNVVVLRPTAVVEIETYSVEEIARWDREDRLEPTVSEFLSSFTKPKIKKGGRGKR